MFKPLFEAMNEMLDEIIEAYPTAAGMQKNQLTENLSVLKKMSDTYIEEWLQFEEKLGKLYGKPKAMGNQVEPNQPAYQSHEEAINEEAYTKGQGYYKLLMFEHAAKQFEQVVGDHPEFLMARLYMALCYFQMGKQIEAYRHFQWICDYFEKIYEADSSPSFYSLS